MNYLTVRQAAEKWGVSARLVQKYCAGGRIPGAQKFGAAWGIPADAVKPRDPRTIQAPPPAPPREPSLPQAEESNLMPLLNTAFEPGQCRRTIEEMPPGPRRDIALAEYWYFSGQPEQAVQAAELYLTSPDIELRLSACLLCAYANLSLGQINRTRMALAQLKKFLVSETDSPRLRVAQKFAAAAGAVLLHLPLPGGLLHAPTSLALLPPGLRCFAMYVYAHYAYLQGEYEKSLGVVEATLALPSRTYPIPAIYLHMAAVMDCMSLRRPDQARAHLLAAWQLARPDDLIEAFGEHHGLLGGMLEAELKKNWPEDFKRIIAITYRFSAGWRGVHNPVTGHDVAGNLTTTEFAAAMLAARGWTNAEIGQHMNLSPNTVKRHLSSVMQKLHIRHRQELKKYMLQ